MPPPWPDEPAHKGPTDSYQLCAHCDMLGVSSVVLSDTESTDILHCTLCELSFHFTTEGGRVIVTRVEPYVAPEN
jgi:transcription elongation factor Elf1